MYADAFIHHLTTHPEYKQQIVHIQHVPPREPKFGALERLLHPSLEARLKSLGISSLYSHQAQAINTARNGKNIMVATASASGKTLCYNLAVLQSLLEGRPACALYLFPTKALAQDQLRSLRELACPELVGYTECATFDGDTPLAERREIKKRAKIVLTNPDMLHVGILPNHGSWSRLFRNLKYVVVDEAHVYRGVFGSHVANILRRLRRICAIYGSSPQFICCSATIANPGEHAQRLVGLPFEVIADDGSPSGGKLFVFWNPPLAEKKVGRRSANSEATFLFTELVRNNIRSLVFTRTRKLTELVYLYTRNQLEPELAQRISPYRAGYLPELRRQIEKALFQGELLGAVATNALELGIDIGDLEATVLVGYPGSISSTWQQAGRSGRRGGSSLSFLIAHDDPLDQYLMNHPDHFFGSNFEHALTNWENPNILKPHLLCAAWESPLVEADSQFFGDVLKHAITELETEGKLRRVDSRWYLSPRVAQPAPEINIRSSSGEVYAVLDASQGYALLETVEASVAFFQIHPGAVYLHQGESYVIQELDLQRKLAIATPADVNYYTQTKEIIDISIVSKLSEKTCAGVKVCFGEVEVTNNVVGYKKKMQFTEEVIGEEPLDLPPIRFFTQALWFDVPEKAMEQIAGEGLDLAGGLHAAEHAAIAILPLFALCDRNDIGGVSTPLHADTGKPQIFIYDAYPGGIGIAQKGYEVIEQLWRATLETVRSCPCEEGCPSCVQSPKCGNNNEPLDKRAAITLLQALTSSRESVERMAP